MLTNLIVAITSYYIPVSHHYIIHLKLIQLLYVNSISINLGKIEIDAMWHPAWDPGKEKRTLVETLGKST